MYVCAPRLDVREKTRGMIHAGKLWGSPSARHDRALALLLRAPPFLHPAMSRLPSRIALLLLLGTTLASIACSRSPRRVPGAAPAPAGGTPAGGAPEVGEWESLFDGTTMTGWHNFDTPGKPVKGWQALDGIIERVTAGGDLVTDRTFADFELTLDWRISRGGNSGILYRIDPTASVTYQSGPEMQVLDDSEHADGQSQLTAAGSVYGLYAAPIGVVRAVGYWNNVRLVVRGTHVEHWLNGKQTASYELGSPEWVARVQGSKFRAWPGYGRARRGFIGLQDHGDRVAYRNIRIREFR